GAGRRCGDRHHRRHWRGQPARHTDPCECRWDLTVSGTTAAPPRRGRTSRRLAAAERENRLRAAASSPSTPRRGVRRRGIGHGGRSWMALTLVLVMFGAAAFQLVRIQTVDAATYSAKAAAQQGRTITLPASRGTIYDRNGTPLAFTVQGR